MRVLMLALIVLVAACSGTTTTITGRPTTALVTPAPAATSATVPTDETEPEIPPTTASIRHEDGADDLAGPDDDRAVNGPGYIDIRSVDVTIDEALTLFVTLANPVPTNISFDDEALSYVVILDTSVDGEFDYWLTYENRADGSFTSSLIDYTAGAKITPGSMVAADEIVGGTVRLDEIGNPGSLRMCIVAQQSTPDLEVLAEDNAPDGHCLGGVGPWIEVR